MSTAKKASTPTSNQNQPTDSKAPSGPTGDAAVRADSAKAPAKVGSNTGSNATKTATVKAEAGSTTAAEETVTRTKEKMEEVMRSTQEAYSKGVDESLDTAKDHLAKSSEQLTKGWEEASQNGQETLKAWSDAHSALIKGAEDVAKIWFSVSQTLIDQNIQTTKSMMTASSVSELVDLQSVHAKSSFDMMVSEMTRISELSLKAANEAMEPLNQRVNAAMEQAAKPLAA